MIPQRKIQDIRDRSADDIVDIIGSYIQLKRSGNSYKAKCPFHEENTASFSVSTERGMYKCFGCGESGDAIDFIMKHEGLDFMETIKQLARRYMIDISGDTDYTPQNRGKSFKEKQESVLPGITAIRSEIRKQEYLMIFLDKQAPQKHQGLDVIPWLQVDPPVSQGQFLIIKKYTENIYLCSEAYELASLLTTVKNGLKAEMSLKIYEPFSEKEEFPGFKKAKSMDWLAFIMQRWELTEGILDELKKIIAHIPNQLTYKIYQQEFIKQLKQTSKK